MVELLPINVNYSGSDKNNNLSLHVSLKGLTHDNSTSRTDLDSHAEACVLGRNCLIFQDYNKTVTVTGYDPSGPTISA